MELNEELIEKLIYYLILKSNCSNNYFYNLYAMGSKLWALGYDYKPQSHKAILESKIHCAIRLKEETSPEQCEMEILNLKNSLGI